jgi:hypothetical protein
VSLLVSVKFAVRSVVVCVKLAVGATFGAVTVTGPLKVSVAPSSSMTVSVTVYVPADA